MTTLRVRTVTSGALDAFGNAARTVGTPTDWVVTGFAPGAIQEPWQANRDASVVAWTVYAKSASGITETSEVEVDGTWYPVNGRPSDWTRGPYGSAWAGVVVELRTVEG